MKGRLGLLACQIAIPAMLSAGERDVHLARVAGRVNEALLDRWVDLVVLPELASVDYAPATFDRLTELAEPLDGPSFRTFAALARRHRTTIVYGFPRRNPTGYRICQAAVGPDGHLLGYYDKLHIAHYGASTEKDYFERGERLLVFELNGLRIAPIICYDIRIPELTRTLCRAYGVELILHCGAYYDDPSYYSWPHFAVTRALENQVYLLSLNRAGDHYGGSMFCPPWVDETQPEVRWNKDETLAVFEVDRATIDQARQTYSFLADTLADYCALGV